MQLKSLIVFKAYPVKAGILILNKTEKNERQRRWVNINFEEKSLGIFTGNPIAAYQTEERGEQIEKNSSLGKSNRR